VDTGFFDWAIGGLGDWMILGLADLKIESKIFPDLKSSNLPNDKSANLPIRNQPIFKSFTPPFKSLDRQGLAHFIFL
jgi:hypothetical protein